MSDYRSNVDLHEVVGLIAAAGRIAVTTHAKPDGDAFGSVAATVAALRRKRPDAVIEGWLMGPVLASFKGLRGWPLLREFSEGSNIGEPDLVIILDTGAWAQVSPMRPQLEARLERTLIIDHHISGDIPARHMLIDSGAAAACSVVADVLDAIADFDPSRSRRAADQNPFFADPVVTESLFAGIASDTGWFRFSNTTAGTHRLAARLIEAGVDQSELYARLEQADRPQKLALQLRALKSVRLLAGDRVAMMVLRAADFAETGALAEETERFVDMPQSVETVKMVVMVTEPPSVDDGGAAGGGAGGASGGAGGGASGGKRPAVRVSFRSKPGPSAINVAEFAQQFGGGGHARAAGAKIDAPVDDVVERIEASVMAAMR